MNQTDKDENQIVRCPICNDPLGVNSDGEYQPCAGCNESNY